MSRRTIFHAIAALMIATPWAALLAAWEARERRHAIEDAHARNASAWERSFQERGLPVPDHPRDGWWMGEVRCVPDPELGWRLAERHAPELDVEPSGLQREGAGRGRKVLVTGGSVAVGAGASTREATYFARLARALDREVVVVAAGAWKVEQEILALRRVMPVERPATVVMLTGLNNLTIGPDSRARGAGSSCVKDEADRARDFLNDVDEATAIVGTELVVVLQPALETKDPLTAVEQRLTQGAERTRLVRQGLARVREGLSGRARCGRLRFLDLSGAFAGEPTTMLDEWHFADPGHTIVADRLAEFLGQ